MLTRFSLPLRRGDTARGVGLAAALMALWAALLVSGLRAPFASMSAAEVAARVALQTWLYTGLFITAHDAMHGTLAPGRPRLNAGLGALAVGLYALFPYATLAAEHQRHHRHPGTADDPDFHAEGRPGFWPWYLRFVGHYVRIAQVAAMAAVFNGLQHGLRLDQRNLLLFWVLPSLLSTLQLFYFGTWLPHREGAPFADAHRARSNAYGAFASLVSCFHFGYHWEHHAAPSVPWWRLPEARRAAAQTAGLRASETQPG